MKTYIYCTKGKGHNDIICNPISEPDKGHYFYGGLKGRSAWVHNRRIVAECEVHKVDRLTVGADSKLGRRYGNICGRLCQSQKELLSYGKGKELFAYYLDNIVPTDLLLGDLYKDKELKKPFSKMTGAYMFAYDILKIPHSYFLISREPSMVWYAVKHSKDEQFAYIPERVLIISAHPKQCVNICNLVQNQLALKSRIDGVEVK